MKRTEQCPDCSGTGRDESVIAKHPEHRLPPLEGEELGELVHEAYEGPAQCDRCAGRGLVGEGYVDRTIKVPHDHPRAAEIAALLKEAK